METYSSMLSPIEVDGTLYEPTIDTVDRRRLRAIYQGGSFVASVTATTLGRTVSRDNGLHNYQRGREGADRAALTLSLQVEHRIGDTHYPVLDQMSVHEGLSYPPTNEEELERLRTCIGRVVGATLSVVSIGRVE